MSEEKKKPTPEEKAEAIAKAKAAAAAKAKAAGAAGEDDEKAKAIAAAKAKAAAAAAAKAKAAGGAEGDSNADAKAKAAAAAKAKAAGAAGGDDEKAKAIAAAKAKAAAAAAAKTKAAGNETPAEPKKPSPKQPVLDHIVKVITQKLGKDVVEDAYINELSEHIPTLVIKKESLFETARLLRDHEELAFDYLSLSLGVDYETYMESVFYIYSYAKRENACIKVKVDRDNPRVASVMPIWAGADWFERETYDLLGIVYEGHANLKRIMLPDTWVGHPLRKDYVQYDGEV